MFSKNELLKRQSWSLPQKIDHSIMVLETFLCATQGNAYASFSGGKDSTALLDLIRRFLSNYKIPAVFCNTGNEYPDIVKFVRQTPDVVIVKPKYTIKQIIEKYGFPLVSKEVSKKVYQLKHTKSDKLKYIILNGSSNGKTGKLSKCWRFLAEAPFDVSDQCCHYLKKAPLEKYGKQTGRSAIIGTMANESRLRLQDWLIYGCNAFEKTKMTSHPLSIWTDKDVWEYIKMFNVPYSPIYNDPDIKRTGCMCCGFGCNKDISRFNFLKLKYPKAYNTFMNIENNGIKYKDAFSYCRIKLPNGKIYQQQELLQ
jgi:3'-phosphoadenosine 5'-phosphosulfate sulfotransferase (PAPS reductase)/FAD synthetase